MARMDVPWCQLLAEYGKWNSVYRRYADWCNRNSTVRCAREGGRRAPKRDGSGPWPQPRRLQHPDPHPSGSTGTFPVLARQPASRPLGQGLTDSPPQTGPMTATLSARGYHSGPGPAYKSPAPRPGTVPSTQRRGTGSRGQHWRRVVTRYDQRASLPRFSVFGGIRKDLFFQDAISAKKEIQ